MSHVIKQIIYCKQKIYVCKPYLVTCTLSCVAIFSRCMIQMNRVILRRQPHHLLKQEMPLRSLVEIPRKRYIQHSAIVFQYICLAFSGSAIIYFILHWITSISSTSNCCCICHFLLRLFLKPHRLSCETLRTTRRRLIMRNGICAQV